MSENVLGCTRKCWEAYPCPTHGHDMTPFGRSAPLSFYVCCENYGKPAINPRHLWDEHDGTRVYTDRVGWNLHATLCEEEDCEVYL
jgi:hypothetical protein